VLKDVWDGRKIDGLDVVADYIAEKFVDDPEEYTEFTPK
jgi:hypothetical protein